MAGYSATFTVVDNATKQIDAINKRITQMRAPFDRLQKSSAKFLDVSGLKRISEGFRSVTSSVLSSVEAMGRMVPVLGAITGAASIGGVLALTKSFLDMGTQLERNADSLELTTAQLQLMQNATILAGGSADDMTKALQGLSKSSYDALRGVGDAQAEFWKAGIALKDANGHLRTSAELLPEALKWIDHYTDARDRQAVADRLGGDALYQLDEDFRRSKKSYADWVKEARGYGVILDPDELNAYRQAVGQLTLSFNGLGTEISSVVAEALTPLIKDFATFIHEHHPEIVKAIRDIAAAFKEWVEGGGIQRTITALEGVADVVGKIVKGIEYIVAHPALAGAGAGAVAGGMVAGVPGAVAGAVVGGAVGEHYAEKPWYDAYDKARTQWFKDHASGADKRDFNQFTRDYRKAHPPSMQHGGIVPINAHAGEMVLPRPISEGLQQLYMGRFSSMSSDGGGAGGYLARMASSMLGWLSGGTGYHPIVELSPETINELTTGGAGGGELGSPLGRGGGGGGSGGGGGGSGGGRGGGAAAPPANVPTPNAGGSPAAFKAAIEDTESPGGRYNNAPLPGHSATGPRQMLPSTFAQYALPGERIDNPADNRRVSDRMIDALWQKYGGDAAKVAYAYANGSPGAPDRNPGYVAKFMQNYTRRQAMMPASAPIAPTSSSPGDVRLLPGTPNAPGGAYGIPGAVMNYADTTKAIGQPGQNLTQITDAQGHRVTVNQAAAKDFQEFLGDLEARGYKASDVQGYGGVNRMKRGGAGLSEHAYGAAIDINPGKNPFGGTATDMPPDIAQLAAAHGLVWGGLWRGATHDPMHFQWAGPQASKLAAERRMAGQAPNAQMAQASPRAANGQVDINVTHRNPPTGSTVTASATGSGIRVGDPRVEHQEFQQP